MMDRAFERFDTNDFPPHLMDRWDEFARDTLVGMDIMPHDKTDYSARLSRLQVGKIGLSWVETSAVTIAFEGGPVGAWSAPAGDAFLFNIQETGTCTMHYCGREIVTRPGDIFLIDASLMLPWHVTNNEPMSNLTLKFPADRMLAMAADAELHCGNKFSVDNPRVGLASSMLLAIKRTIENNPDEDWDENYGDLLIDIVATTLSGYPPLKALPRNRSLRRRACASIERSLDDPDLDVGRIATDLNTSVRTIQRIFLEIGFTPRRYILERRIAAAAERIRRGSEQTSITDVALSVGFNDLSYFARSFRKQMGVSARDYRAGKIGPVGQH